MIQSITQPFSSFFLLMRVSCQLKHCNGLPIEPSNMVIANLMAYSAALFVADTESIGKTMWLLN